MIRAACALVLLASVSAFAAGGIVPTGDPGSDCVAAKIYAKTTPQNRPFDEVYCAINKNAAAYKNCVDNLAKETEVAFFTDRCNAPEDGAYVSFNGKTHQVWRKAGPSHADVIYAGFYEGPELAVRIVPTRLLQRHIENSEPVGVSYAVDVFITYKNDRVKVTARYEDGP